MEILTHRQGFDEFSFIDFYSGYNQSWMAPEDAKKTAFRTPKGNFYNKVIPFGLREESHVVFDERYKLGPWRDPSNGSLGVNVF